MSQEPLFFEICKFNPYLIKHVYLIIYVLVTNRQKNSYISLKVLSDTVLIIYTFYQSTYLNDWIPFIKKSGKIWFIWVFLNGQRVTTVCYKSPVGAHVPWGWGLKSALFGLPAASQLLGCYQWHRWHRKLQEDRWF